MPVLPPARRAALSSGLDAFLASSSSSSLGLTILYSNKPNWPFKSARGQASDEGTAAGKETIDIAVLDSSFNPPTLAHRAIALGPALLVCRPGSSTVAGDSTPIASADPKPEYDAHLLLFSVRNADKGLGRRGDASQLQRLEMMELLAKEIEAFLRKKTTGQSMDAADDGSGGSSIAGAAYEPAVAVGIVDPPLMFEKSTLVHKYMQDLLRKVAPNTASPTIRLHWQVGMDTLERFFALRYYPSTQAFHASAERFFNKEGTTFVVASRVPSSLPGKSMENESEEQLLRSELVQPWVEQHKVALWQLPTEVQGCSSTDVRKLYRTDGATSTEELIRQQQQKVPASIAHYLDQERVYGEARRIPPP
ncbi:hypothetical protein K437DRAFT_259796 [Tilletiaria anomala UBC 951]|uniref:Nicotinamide-nucleotide adenylyltransferase n=1 Tax=Tilletiaria anomala (strain ATCC 24038 / CBS 436.72 / UBC 951) TaxID=1037660 RepID=A0A066V6P7_TILAU|nr:uncharacterized protein K437DRAFT_259796 [Tilletiaria anomala UBC 951]KDN37412.1 hypothetical protein K437DRAFT_259796 [Tilletiaria anomala UBC 951]